MPSDTTIPFGTAVVGVGRFGSNALEVVVAEKHLDPTSSRRSTY